MGKIYSSSCRRNEVLPHTLSFIVRVNIKDEKETHICTKNKSLQKVMDKWTLQSNFVCVCVCVCCVCVWLLPPFRESSHYVIALSKSVNLHRMPTILVWLKLWPSFKTRLKKCFWWCISTAVVLCRDNGSDLD